MTGFHDHIICLAPGSRSAASSLGKTGWWLPPLLVYTEIQASRVPCRKHGSYRRKEPTSSPVL